MNNGKQPWRIPWSSLIISAMLGAGVYVFLQFVVFQNTSVPPLNLALAAFTFVVTFWVVKTVQYAFWGLLAASILVFHPLYIQTISTSANRLMLSVLLVELLALVCVLGIWHSMVQETPRIGSMFGVMALLVITGVIGWLLSPHAGWVTGFLAASGFLLTGVFIVATGTAKLPIRLTWCVGAVVLAGVLPAVCLLLTAPTLQAAEGVIDPSLGGWLQLPVSDACTVERVLSTAYQPQITDNLFPGFGPNELSDWTWPQMYVTLPLMGLAIWLSLRRGWLHCRKNCPPLPWALLLFSASVLLANSLHPQSVRDLHLLPLISVTVLLSVFTIGDLVLSFGEAVRLQPPDEEPVSPTQVAKDT